MFLLRNHIYFLLSREDANSYNNLMMIHDLSKGFMTILLLALDLDLWALAIGLHVGNFASLLYGMKKTYEQVPWRWTGSFSQLRHMLRYSIKIYVSEAFGYLTVYLSNLITAIFLTPTSLAFFSMGKGKAEWLTRITNAIGAMLYPRVSNLMGKNENPSATVTTIFRVSLLVLLATAVFFSIAIYPATIVLYGRTFLPLLKSFFIVLPALIFFSATNLLRQYFLGIGRADIPMKLSIVPLIMQLGLCFLLIPIFGFVGGAFSVSVSYVLTSGLILFVYRKLAHTSLTELLLPRKADFQMVSSVIRQRAGLIGNRLLRKKAPSELVLEKSTMFH